MAGKRILIVEDYPETVEMVKTFLTLKGFAVSVAMDGQAGLQTAQAEKPDMVLLDLMLPKLNGIEVLRKLKENGATAKIPVIIITVRTESDEIKEAIALGAEYYIIKPFDVNDLFKIITRYI